MQANKKINKKAVSKSQNEIAKKKEIKSKTENVVSASKHDTVKNKVIKSKTKIVDSKTTKSTPMSKNISNKNKKYVGFIYQVLGPLVDVKFENGNLPNINKALYVKNGHSNIVLDVSQIVGDDVVRCIPMEPTNGSARNTPVTDSADSIKAPLGKEVLGRMFNLIGVPTHEKPFTCKNYKTIHRSPPSFSELSNSVEVGS